MSHDQVLSAASGAELPRPATYDERVQKMVSLTRGPRVLHVGACGNTKPTLERMPHFAQAALVDAGFSVLATDINEAGIEWMRSLGWEARYLDADRLEDADEQFDSVFAGELIEHLSNPGRFLDGCAAVLKPGGRLILSTPQAFAPIHFLLHGMRYGKWVNEEHVSFFDPQTLTQLLRRHGFAVEELALVNDIRPKVSSWKIRALANIQNRLRGRWASDMVVSASFAGVVERSMGEAADASWS